MSERGLRAAGFLVLMLGLGLRLDTAFQGLAWVLVVGGAGTAALGLLRLATRPPDGGAFVPRPGQR